MVDDGTREHDSIDLVSDTPEVQPPKEIEQKPQKVEKPA